MPVPRSTGGVKPVAFDLWEGLALLRLAGASPVGERAAAVPPRQPDLSPGSSRAFSRPSRRGGAGGRFPAQEEGFEACVWFLLSVDSMPSAPVGGMSSAPSRRGFTYDFSIWYCPEDDHIASRISERLKKEGFRGYAEHQDQVAGSSVIQTVVEAIEASRVAILLLSAKSLRDPWCQRVSQWNLCHIICHGTKMIPVYVGVKKAEVPSFLHHLIELDYQTEFFFDRLVESLRTSRSAASKAGRAPSSKAKS